MNQYLDFNNIISVINSNKDILPWFILGLLLLFCLIFFIRKTLILQSRLNSFSVNHESVCQELVLVNERLAYRSSEVERHQAVFEKSISSLTIEKDKERQRLE